MAKFGIGQPVRRVEDQRFLIGKGRYVDDIVLPGMAFGVNVLSPHAHARIKTVDVSKAKAAPGVLAVLTGADVAADKLAGMTAHLMPEDFGAPKGHRTFLPLLVADKVRCIGDRVAFVVAETEAQARDAAELVAVEYEPLKAVVNIEDAAKEGAPKVHDDNNMGNTAFRLMFGNQEATDAVFAKAKHVVKLRVENNRVSPVSMEPRVAIGDYEAATDQYTLYSASQNPHGVRMEISHIFHVPENQIRVISPDVGGGFGLKGGAYPDDLLVMWTSKKLGRPVKWVASRSESMMNDAHGREMVYYGELALDDSGKILALRSKSLFQMGAWFVNAALAAGAFSIRFVPEAYDIQTMHLMSQGVFTNTSFSGPYRGAGRPEAAYFMERLIEHAARADRHGRRGDPPPQPDPAVEAAVHHPDPLGLRFRRVRQADGYLHRHQRSQGLPRARARIQEERQAARPRGQLLHRVRRHLQRPHGAALRSFRRADRVRRHALARPGPRHGVRAGRARVPRRAVRADQVRAGRYGSSRDRPRHLWRALGRGRRQRAQARDRADDREGQGARRRHDGGGRRRHRVQGRHLSGQRHRQEDRAGRRRQGVVRADGAADPEVRHRARG